MTSSMKSYALFSTLAGFLLASPADSAPLVVSDTAAPQMSFSRPIVLGVYDAEADTDMTVITARLSEKPAFDSVKLEDHGSFFQVVLPNVIIPHPGQFSDGKGPYAKRLAAYQLNPTDGAIRIFLEGDSKALASATTAEILNDRLVVTIDHRGLAGKTQKTGAESGKVTTLPSDATASGELTPADLARSNTGTTAIGSNVVDLSSRLNSVAVFSGVMLIGLLVLYFTRNFMRRKGSLESGESFQMKTLSSMVMAPKQRLTLIEVCNERILVGVSPGQISYLTTLGGSAKKSSAIAAEPTVALPAQIQQYFQKQVPIMQQTVDLKPTPNVSIEESIESKPAPRRSTRTTPTPNEYKAPDQVKEPARRINVAISDDGIQSRGELQNRSSKSIQQSEEPKDIGDVTRIIREKLKNLAPRT